MAQWLFCQVCGLFVLVHVTSSRELVGKKVVQFVSAVASNIWLSGCFVRFVTVWPVCLSWCDKLSRTRWKESCPVRVAVARFHLCLVPRPLDNFPDTNSTLSFDFVSVFVSALVRQSRETQQLSSHALDNSASSS